MLPQAWPCCTRWPSVAESVVALGLREGEPLRPQGWGRGLSGGSPASHSEEQGHGTVTASPQRLPFGLGGLSWEYGSEGNRLGVGAMWPHCSCLPPYLLSLATLLLGISLPPHSPLLPPPACVLDARMCRTAAAPLCPLIRASALPLQGHPGHSSQEPLQTPCLSFPGVWLLL